MGSDQETKRKFGKQWIHMCMIYLLRMWYLSEYFRRTKQFLRLVRMMIKTPTCLSLVSRLRRFCDLAARVCSMENKALRNEDIAAVLDQHATHQKRDEIDDAFRDCFS